MNWSIEWRRSGHIARITDNHWTKRVTEWQPRSGKGKEGNKSDGRDDNRIQKNDMVTRGEILMYG